MKAEVYERITSRIVGELELGVKSWLKPWNAEHMAGRISRPLRWNGKPYSGINVIMLWGEATTRGYACPIWMTYKQAQELGGQVRKGEGGSLVVYADRITRTDTDAATGKETEREIPFLKGYTVFNCEQIDRLPTHYYATVTAPLDAVQRNAGAEAFFAATGASIRHGGNQAYYAVHDDHVQMPPLETFRDAESYYATLSHEVTHYAGFRIMPRRHLAVGRNSARPVGPVGIRRTLKDARRLDL